jgi:hypothetical protein
LLWTNVDLLCEENVFWKLKGVYTARRCRIFIFVRLAGYCQTRRRLVIFRFLDKEEPQGFFNYGFFVGELAVLDPFSHKPLKIFGESDVHLRTPTNPDTSDGFTVCILPQQAVGGQNPVLPERKFGHPFRRYGATSTRRSFAHGARHDNDAASLEGPRRPSAVGVRLTLRSS